MKDIKWNIVKSERLKRARGVSFEEILSGTLVAVKKHPKRKNQDIMIIRYKRYLWIVPYIEDKDYIFLKTLYPSRKYTKIYKEDLLK
ncbi:MAG: toxin [Candidatus Omnitrophica bacterium]|nr:toxin [Candidatus Omnitrophota bacterium]